MKFILNIAAMCLGLAIIAAAGSASACPQTVWSGVKGAPAGWTETQTRLSGPTERIVGGSRIECHYNDINRSAYIWRNSASPETERCPARVWIGPKNAPGAWRETQTQVQFQNKRINGSRVECHYPTTGDVYIWRETSGGAAQAPACPQTVWSGSKRAPEGWNETQDRLSGAARREIGGSRTECHYRSINATSYIWRNAARPNTVRCPSTIWVGPKDAPSPWRVTQTRVELQSRRVSGNRVECHYPAPADVYIWQ